MSGEVPAIDVVRANLLAAGFHQLASDIGGAGDVVVRPDRPLTWPEAEAFLKIRRKAYLAAGLRPCQCTDDTDDCPTLDADGQTRCFADDEAWFASQLRDLQLPSPRHRKAP